MNSSNIRHALLALTIQFGAGVPLNVLGMTDAMWVSGAFAVGGFVFREHAQRELQISIARGLASVAQLTWWEGFTGWDRDRYFDAGCPALACFVAALF